MSLILPQETIFGMLANVLEEHFEPQPLIIADRFKFHNCKKQSSHSVVEFVAKAKLTSTCRFEGH